MKRNLTCIICPKGCSLCAEIDGQQVRVTGNTCPKGAEYAVAECTNPVRTVTSIVRVTNRKDTMVSVKTAQPVPKEKMWDVMAALRSVQVSAPVKIGDVILPEMFGTAVIATKAID
jgi:CxxC motif-containing protein